MLPCSYGCCGYSPLLHLVCFWHFLLSPVSVSAAYRSCQLQCSRRNVKSATSHCLVYSMVKIIDAWPQAPTTPEMIKTTAATAAVTHAAAAAAAAETVMKATRLVLRRGRRRRPRRPTHDHSHDYNDVNSCHPCQYYDH